jgi:tRNA threonylcarbamoyladenosine biosynthesis protein TsaE
VERIVTTGQNGDESDCLRLRGATAEETTEIGRLLGAWLRAGDVVLLSGPLGAGKTTLTQGIAAGVGVDDYVTSPSFTLVNEYRPKHPRSHPVFYHLDLYRISGAAEALDFGLDEYVGGEGIAVIEWAERAAEAMPRDYLLVRLSIADVDSGERLIEICPHGAVVRQRVSSLRAALAQQSPS